MPAGVLGPTAISASSCSATLSYYCPRRSSNLFDLKESDSRPHEIYDEAVIVEKNGLLYPAVDAASGWYMANFHVNKAALSFTVSNGTVMFSNTFMMQELVRRYLDEVLDREDQGKQVESPFCTIAKGRNRYPATYFTSSLLTQIARNTQFLAILFSLTNTFLSSLFNRHRA